ncbi:hypothetical protein CRG98_048733, partial [Punica granatum]
RRRLGPAIQLGPAAGSFGPVQSADAQPSTDSPTRPNNPISPAQISRAQSGPILPQQPNYPANF